MTVTNEAKELTPVSDGSIDLGDVYERTKEAARAAVGGTTHATYGLLDVLPAQTWQAVTSSPMMSLIPLHGTLNGCVEALQARGLTAAQVQQVQGPSSGGSAVTARELRLAQVWLTDALAEDLDEDSRQAMVDDAAIDGGWVGKPGPVTSMVLALVMTASAAAA